MYNPIQDGIEKKVRSVQYVESMPPTYLSGFVHCYWELKSDGVLEDDFHLHALPDACVNILFNQVNISIAGVTALRTTSEVLNLGKLFHYVGIQFLPGVWQGDRLEISNNFVGTPYLGQLPLIETSTELVKANLTEKQAIMSNLVNWLISQKLVVANIITEQILANINNIYTVTDMATFTNMSPRQLQRTLKLTTGFSPHDLLKVLRMQQSFKRHHLDLYADQSHFIHSFRSMTGYTPAKYINKFDV